MVVDVVASYGEKLRVRFVVLQPRLVRFGRIPTE